MPRQRLPPDTESIALRLSCGRSRRVLLSEAPSSESGGTSWSDFSRSPERPCGLGWVSGRWGEVGCLRGPNNGPCIRLALVSVKEDRRLLWGAIHRPGTRGLGRASPRALQPPPSSCTQELVAPKATAGVGAFSLLKPPFLLLLT